MITPIAGEGRRTRRKGTRRGAAPGVGLNTTVMVDVLFILLIFFIIVSRIRTSSIDVEVPKVARKAPPKFEARRQVKKLNVLVTADDRIFVQGRSVGPEQLQQRLLEISALPDWKDPRVVISSDDRCRARTLLGTVNALAFAGFTKIEFSVEEKRGGQR